MCVTRCVLVSDVASMLCDCKCLTGYCTGELEFPGFSSGNRWKNSSLNPQLFLHITHVNAVAFLSNSFIFSEKLAVCEMKKNTFGPYAPQMTIQRMRTACWITKATHTYTHTLRICNTYCYSTAKIVTRTRTRRNIRLYTHPLFCFI